MFCPNCGKENINNSPYCVQCGMYFNQANSNIVQQNVISNIPDAKSFGFAFLSFLVPLVGIVLYIIWKDETPLKAKSCLKGVIVSIIFTIALVVLMFFGAFLIYMASSTGFVETSNMILSI